MRRMNDLWNVIKKRICLNHNLNETFYYPGSNEDIFIKYHVNQIFILEIILHEHRKKYSNIFEPLIAKHALHHLIFIKTLWKPAEIRNLSFLDSLFIISEEFQIDRFPNEYKLFIQEIDIPKDSIIYNQILEADWDPKGNSIFLMEMN